MMTNEQHLAMRAELAALRARAGEAFVRRDAPAYDRLITRADEVDELLKADVVERYKLALPLVHNVAAFVGIDARAVRNWPGLVSALKEAPDATTARAIAQAWVARN